MAYSQQQAHHRYPGRRGRGNPSDGMPPMMPPVSSQMQIRHPFPLQHMVSPGQGGRMPLLAPNQPLAAMIQPPGIQPGLPPSLGPIHPGQFTQQNVPLNYRFPLQHTFPPTGMPPLPMAAPPLSSGALVQPSQMMNVVTGRVPPPIVAGGGVTPGGGAPPPKKKQPSKAIKIVNPETMKEVDLSEEGTGGTVGVRNQTPRSVSPAPTPPRAEGQNVATMFRQQVHQMVKPPNAIISAPPPPGHSTYTPKASPARPFEEPAVQTIPSLVPSGALPPQPHAASLRLGGAPQVAATGQYHQTHRPPDMNPPQTQPFGAGAGLLATPDGPPYNYSAGSHVTANGAVPPLMDKSLGSIRPDLFHHTPPFTDVSLSVVPPSSVLGSGSPGLIQQEPIPVPGKPVPELAQGLEGGGKQILVSSELTDFPQQQKQPLLPTPVLVGSHSVPAPPSSHPDSTLMTTATPPTVTSSVVVPETGETAKSEEIVTPPMSLVAKDSVPKETVTMVIPTETVSVQTDKTVTDIPPEPPTSSVSTETDNKESVAVETKDASTDVVEATADVKEEEEEREAEEEVSESVETKQEPSETTEITVGDHGEKTEREGEGEVGASGDSGAVGDGGEGVEGEGDVIEGVVTPGIVEESTEGERETETIVPSSNTGNAEEETEREERVSETAEIERDEREDERETKEKEKEEEEVKDEETPVVDAKSDTKEETIPAVGGGSSTEVESLTVEKEQKTEVVMETKPDSTKPKQVASETEEPSSLKATTSLPARKTTKPAPAAVSGTVGVARQTQQPRPSAREASPSGGRTTYDRDFLLKFRDLPVCTTRPPNLINHDCLRQEGGNTREHLLRDPRDLARMRHDIFNPFGGGGGGGGGSRGARRRDPPPPKIIRIDQKPVELHKADQPWVPAKERLKELSEEEKMTAELYRKFQAILNKLTPQKFQSLAEQALQLTINTEERLKGVIDKIFTKALEEPNFSIAYANLCKVLSPLKVEVEIEGKSKFTTFRRVLLTKCQQEFEKDKKDDEEREEMLAAVQKATSEEKKKELEEELKVMETKARKRSLGNIRFIGELFKLKMLSETIMHECMVRLLKSSSDEESLECFAGLITTTGKDLDTTEAKVRINGYFGRIQHIIAKGKISARIRFMLQDIQELRENKWVPRSRQTTSLKTIDQIHAEAKAEEQRTLHMVAQHQMSTQFKPQMRGDDKRGRRDNKGDEWQKVGDEKRGRRDEKPTKFDPKRITNLLKRGGDRPKDASLGPQGGMLRPGWPQKGTATPETSSGSLSSSGGSAKSDKDKSVKPLRSSSGGAKRGEREKGTSGVRPTKRSSSREMSKEREAAIRAVKTQTSTEAKPHPQPLVSKATPPPQSATPNPPLDEDLISRKTNTIAEELFENKDFKEAIECVKEMKCQPQLNVFVREILNQTMEKSDSHRLMASQLLRELLRDGELGKDKFREGLEEVMEYAEDIEIDIPRFWDYLAQLLSHPVSDPSLIPLSLVTSLMPAPLVKKGKVGVLATKVMKQLTAGMCAESEVVSLWQGLSWDELGVKGEDLKDLLARENLGFLLERVSSTQSQLSSQLSELLSRIQASDITNDDIITWIEKNCGSELRTPDFIRMLSTALLQAFVSGRGKYAKFRAEDFLRRSVVLKKFADSQRELHMHILYAFQSGVHRLEHPPELLSKIFHLLYEDLELVEEATFVDWKERGSESLGKGVAVHSLAGFYQWLDRANQESDTES